MRIGIVTPAFNVAPWIGDAIRSVLAQSHADWRMVVVDDGSRDATADVVAGFTDPRLRLIRQDNAGVSAARNRALAAVEGDALLFLDADDWLTPDTLARLAVVLAASSGAVVAAACPAAFVPVGASGITGGLHPPAGDLLERLLERNLFANGGQVLVRRGAIVAAGGFRADLAYGEDWALWVRLALLGPFASVGGPPGLFVRQRPESACRRLAHDPAAFNHCLDAIFGDPALAARLGSRLPMLRRRADAERDWIIGRELIRQAQPTGMALASLGRSFAAKPSTKRLALLAVVLALPLLPPSRRGPFAPYTQALRCLGAASGAAATRAVPTSHGARAATISPREPRSHAGNCPANAQYGD
jgi:hypothetical protein